jgi:hypothetical protein
VLAKRQFTAMFPNDPLRVTDEFASFMGLFGQVCACVWMSEPISITAHDRSRRSYS